MSRTSRPIIGIYGNATCPQLSRAAGAPHLHPQGGWVAAAARHPDLRKAGYVSTASWARRNALRLLRPTGYGLHLKSGRDARGPVCALPYGTLAAWAAAT